MRKIFIAILFCAGLYGQGTTPGAITRQGTIPASCKVGSSNSILYNNAGTDEILTCDNTGHYSLPPGGSTSTLTASGVGASGAAGANKLTGPASSIITTDSSGNGSVLPTVTGDGTLDPVTGALAVSKIAGQAPGTLFTLNVPAAGITQSNGSALSPATPDVGYQSPVINNVTNHGTSTTGIASTFTFFCGTIIPCPVNIPSAYATTEALPGESTATGTVDPSSLNTNIVGSPALTSNNIHTIDMRYVTPYTVDVNCVGKPLTSGGYSVCYNENFNRYSNSIVGGVAQTYLNHSLVNNVYSGGSSYNGQGGFFTTSFGNFNFRSNVWTSTIDSNVGIACAKMGLGDSVCLTLTSTGAGGVNSGNDEGTKLYDLHARQLPGEFSGHINGSLATGATVIPFNSPTNNGYAGELRWMIDEAAGGLITGNVTAIANSTTGPTILTVTSATASTAVSTLGTAVPHTTLNTSVTVTPGAFSVGSISNITTSTLVCVADPADFEIVIPSAVNTGAGTFTASFQRPKFANAIISVGGACGYTLDEMVDDQTQASFTGLASGTYVSGITATGAAGTSCNLTGFNNGNVRGAATIALSGTNTVSTAANAIIFSQPGVGSTTAATSATAGNGTATCSGTATLTSTTVSPNIQNIQGTLHYPIPVVSSDTTHISIYTAWLGVWQNFSGPSGLTQWTTSNEAYNLYPSAQVYSVEKDASGLDTGGYSPSVLTVGPNAIDTANGDLVAVTQYFAQREYPGYIQQTNYRPQATGGALLSADAYGIFTGGQNLLSLTNHSLSSNYIPGGGVFQVGGGIGISGEVYRGIGFQQAPDESWMRALSCPSAGCNVTQTILTVPSSGSTGDTLTYSNNQAFRFTAKNGAFTYTLGQDFIIPGGFQKLVSPVTGTSPNMNGVTADLFSQTLTAATTPALNNASSGQEIAVKITEAASGNFAYTFPSNWKGAGPINTANSAISTAVCKVFDGTGNCYATGPTMDSTGNGAFAGSVSATGFSVPGSGALLPNLGGTTGSIGGGALLAGACTSGTVAVTGSTTAMAVQASPVTYPGDGNYWMGYVSTSGTVTVKVCAAVAGTPTTSTYNVRVIQ